MEPTNRRFARSRILHGVISRLLLWFVLWVVEVVLTPSTGLAFWAQGHHAIAVLAYEQLSPEDQTELISLLKHHPRFEQDFKIPDSIIGNEKAIHRWWIGVAAEWPDLIRGNETFDRPTWHYQLGATLVIGDAKHPEDPGPLPENATLETRELYIVQAIELCMKVFHDKTQSDADRAIAFCWLAHLVADAHQPCHAGSLYSPKAFPDGDRGANGIPVKVEGQPNIKNLHAFWDSLLGAEATPESVEARVAMLRTLNLQKMKNGFTPSIQYTPHPVKAKDETIECVNLLSRKSLRLWLEESRKIANKTVYWTPILQNVQLVERGISVKLGEEILDKEYVRSSAKIIDLQAIKGCARLVSLLDRSYAFTLGQ